MVYTYMVERVMEYGGVQEEGSIGESVAAVSMATICLTSLCAVPVMDCAARSHTPLASGMLSRY